jgi:protein-tyrosine phosphatase
VRRLARAVRHLPDRLLHGRRRARASRLLAGLGDAPRILVLCLGNICRSPFAEARLREAGVSRVRSRGFIGPGRPSPPEALAAARDLGTDLGSHVSATVSAADVEWADVVVVMDGRQARRATALAQGRRPTLVRLGDLDPDPIERRAIADPFGRGDAAFATCFERMVRCLEPLEERFGRRGGATGVSR